MRPTRIEANNETKNLQKQKTEKQMTLKCNFEECVQIIIENTYQSQQVLIHFNNAGSTEEFSFKS